MLRNSLLLVLSIAVALVASELVLRAIPGVHNPGVVPLVTRHDPLLGWTLIPNLSATVRTSEFEAIETINSFGTRGPEIPDQKLPGEVRILLLGDSFTEGYTVDDEETIRAVLERRLDDMSARVINAGTRGWSTDQELLFFRENVEILQPDLTVVLLYVNDVCHNTVQRIWRGSKPRFVLEGDGMALTGVPVPPPEFASADEAPRGLKRALRETVESTALYQLAAGATERSQTRRALEELPLPLAAWYRSLDAHPCLEEGWTLTERILSRLSEEAEEAGGGLVVFWIPSREGVYDEYEARARATTAIDPDLWSPTADGERLSEVCERRGLRCVIPLDEFRQAGHASEEPLYYPRDGHWTPRGHELAADLVAAAAREFLADRPRATRR